jgi:hypothetical protein
MQEVDLGGEKSFIGAWYLPDVQVCDELIRFFKQSDKQHPGIIGEGIVDKNTKDSIDVIVPFAEFERPVMRRYLNMLMVVVRAYVNKYERAGETGNWYITEAINIQYYQPGGGYPAWHTERTSNRIPFVNRHLVFMTYLNDVYDQGGTEFLYQKLTVRPKKGLSLIWPTDWTHTHRGIISPTEEKYIITGWFDFA